MFYFSIEIKNKIINILTTRVTIHISKSLIKVVMRNFEKKYLENNKDKKFHALQC